MGSAEDASDSSTPFTCPVTLSRTCARPSVSAAASARGTCGSFLQARETNSSNQGSPRWTISSSNQTLTPKPSALALVRHASSAASTGSATRASSRTRRRAEIASAARSGRPHASAQSSGQLAQSRAQRSRGLEGSSFVSDLNCKARSAGATVLRNAAASASFIEESSRRRLGAPQSIVQS